ncbi:GHKL domain-containing protein [Solobacterium moorei]|uniref:sensor histidine kinase n=1 Tax=Solobacterium moorei TaxID=102148 RepID=UPI0024ACB8D6|nr:sensor histidine kinase [Solobacterium moorei]MDI6414713.1 GHKL domain-containing protein [Solobacterium moorei]
MIAVIILIGLALYEAILKKIQITFMHVVISTVILGIIGYSVYRFSYMLTVWILLCFIWNHYHFFKEERIFSVIVILLYLGIIFLGVYYNGTVAGGIGALIFILLEYLLQTIMKREEDKTIVYQNKLMKQQMDEIENIYMTMRGWRHDYHNHLQSLKGYLSLNKVEQMKNYLNELETDLDSIDTLYHSGNLQLDSILNAKLAIAEKGQIRIHCDASIPPQLHVSDLDLCVILGNLLDNAIESCRKIKDPDERFIRVYIGILKKQLYISITNATSETVKQRTDHYFTTKRGDHGHGLKRVDQVVKKYDGYLNRQNEPGVFATEIVLPL